jgi:hypothetical protein
MYLRKSHATIFLISRNAVGEVSQSREKVGVSHTPVYRSTQTVQGIVTTTAAKGLLGFSGAHDVQAKTRIIPVYRAGA